MPDNRRKPDGHRPARQRGGGQSDRDEGRAPSPHSLHIVGIGASAGGLEACSSLLDALPADGGLAFILVAHLDPTHESLMVELLAAHTAMTVVQAQDGMQVEPDHLYIIPPASFLTLAGGALRLRPAPARRGARMPFDALLLSLAQECGTRASCIVLSGTGTDGSAGVLAIKQAGGLVIAQEPGEAAYGGMPHSAIATGAVDAVLPVAAMPARLAELRPQRASHPPASKASEASEASDCMPDIISLLRDRTIHDFTLYKPGTLKRRVERRMAMAAIPAHDMARYVTRLRADPAEIELLAKDLLIHVTRFFRDPAVFERLARTTVPGLIGDHPPSRTLRIWVAGCSTGEEAYSLAIIFLEQIAASNSAVKVQIFASDADSDAVASARDGLYPAAIEADVTPQRLSAFFSKEDQGYRVSSELRSMIVFTVQDLLVDPPFSRLDFISCRNVMIYLGIEAQRRLIGLFHFALRSGGVLLLGSSENVGDASGRFSVISKEARLYQHVGRGKPGDVNFARNASVRPGNETVALTAPTSRHAALAELCRRHTLANYGPATVLASRKHEHLYSIGPTDRYLRVPAGLATTDLLAMVDEELRTRLRLAILRACQDNAPITVTGGYTMRDGQPLPYTIEVRPIVEADEELLLFHFLDQPARNTGVSTSPADHARVADLERELDSTREELRSAVRSLEIAGDEQKAINDNALSVNEEFQSTNEELLTSKEELQSLNEELTALNSQLQETLEQQRTSANDLQNVLYSTDVATLFLDPDLRIRFFTPAIKALFNIIKTDVGRPLSDLRSLATDESLAADARRVLATSSPIEREVETSDGVWWRRVLPYRTHVDAVEGVVITFTDVTARKHIAQALEAAKRTAELANAAKSRFLAAASHDLRQPLQSLSLLQGLLAHRVEGAVSQKLVARLADTVGAMAGMLNTLLDINQIEAGVIRPEPVDFRVDDLFADLGRNFAYQAQAQGLEFRVVPSALIVHSDRHLLEQMLRNLVSNALKYTPNGKVLLGCRRSGAAVRIEVWDTGIGIPAGELTAVFEEYRQLDNPARERDRGLGLGLAIVHRLGALLGHRIGARSRPGKGSVFSIEVPLGAGSPATPPGATDPISPNPAALAAGSGIQPGTHAASILIVEDDPQVRELLALILGDAGHRTMAVSDGPAALELVQDGAMRPDLLLTDYNLPRHMNGLALATALRERLGPELPVVILTGDISSEALTAITAGHCSPLNKPVDPAGLRRAVQDHLPTPAASEAARPASQPVRAIDTPVVFLVDDDRNIRAALRLLLENDGRVVQDFATGEAFLAAHRPGTDGCLLIDAYLPGISGLELLHRLRAAGDRLPAIVITGKGDVAMAVRAMKAGAADFIEKPIGAAHLLTNIDRALERSRDSSKQMAWQASAVEHVAGLTARQLQIMDLVLAGYPSKNIAADLGISQRTVENHRASIMRKMGTKSLPALARLALAAALKVDPKLEPDETAAVQAIA